MSEVTVSTIVLISLVSSSGLQKEDLNRLYILVCRKKVKVSAQIFDGRALF